MLLKVSLSRDINRFPSFNPFPRRIIRKCSCVDIKQKAGCVSHIDDPTNLRSTFAYTLSTERFVCWRTHVSTRYGVVFGFSLR